MSSPDIRQRKGKNGGKSEHGKGSPALIVEKGDGGEALATTQASPSAALQAAKASAKSPPASAKSAASNVGNKKPAASPSSSSTKGAKGKQNAKTSASRSKSRERSNGKVDGGNDSETGGSDAGEGNDRSSQSAGSDSDSDASDRYDDSDAEDDDDSSVEDGEEVYTKYGNGRKFDIDAVIANAPPPADDCMLLTAAVIGFFGALVIGISLPPLGVPQEYVMGSGMGLLMLYIVYLNFCSCAFCRRGGAKPSGLSPIESFTPQMAGIVCACLGSMLGGMFGGTIRSIQTNGYL